MPTKRSRPVRWHRLAGVLALFSTLLALPGCALLGGPQHLDGELLESISARVSEAQPGLEASLHAESKTCEGLCQHVSVDLSPRTPDYSALDIGIAIHETDVALEEQQISAFKYCFDWRSWEAVDIQYLDARLGEVRGLGYNGVMRDAENQRPVYDCYSFASISGAEQLDEFLRENGFSEG